MIVNLIINNETIEEEAICNVKETVSQKNGKPVKVDLECKVDNINDKEECKGLEIVFSENITGIPEEKNLLNPKIVDELIKAEDIKNYTSNDLEDIPVFNSTSIDTTDSEEKGIFIINGEFLENYKPNKTMKFEIILMTGEKAECTIPKINDKGEIKIECVLEEELKDSKIMIGQFPVLDGYDEIIRLNKISSVKALTVPNGKQILLEQLFDINLLFGQVNNFKPQDKNISFNFAGITTRPLNKNKKIKMKVNLMSDELIEKEATCFAKNDSQPKDGKQVKVDFDCIIEDIENGNKYKGLEIISSKDISGIPNEPELINPAIVDELIKEGEIKDFSREENKEKIESIPIFNTTSIDTSDSLTKGIFIINGNIPSKFELDDELKFQIKLVSGEKAECTLPKVSNNEENIKIECVLQEKIKNSKILIPLFTILDGYNEKIRLNKISSRNTVTAENGKENKINKKFNSTLSFRQTNSFKFDPNQKLVKFDIAVLSAEPLTENKEIKVDVNLLLTLDSAKKEAKCKVKKELKDKIGPVILNCEINNLELEKDIECIGLEIKESENLINVPKDPKLCNPKKTDKLINLGEIKEAKEEINIPEFNATSIDKTGSKSSGKFFIIGKPLKNIVKDLVFNITLITGEIATCRLPKSDKDNETKIECELDGVIEKSKIMIPQTIILSGNKE